MSLIYTMQHFVSAKKKKKDFKDRNNFPWDFICGTLRREASLDWRECLLIGQNVGQARRCLLWPPMSWLPTQTSKWSSNESHRPPLALETLSCLCLSWAYQLLLPAPPARVCLFLFCAYSLYIKDEHSHMSFWLLQSSSFYPEIKSSLWELENGKSWK